MKKNLSNVQVENLSGNLWSHEVLTLLSKQNKEPKKNRVSIWDSANPIKNTVEAKKLCIAKKYKYDLIGGLPYREFLIELTKNDCFIFLPTTVETLCRIVVEARMAGMKTITNKRIGALSEPWFKLKGDDLVEEMIKKRKTIPEKILSHV